MESLEQRVLRLERRVEREKRARVEAESLLELRALSLYDANCSLKELTGKLEEQVESRTQQLNEALKAAEAAVGAKGTFLAMMSHEIRTPLNGIMGLAECLSGLDYLAAEDRSHVDNIIECVQSLRGLVDDILDLSKIEAGKLETESRAFNVIEHLERAVQFFEPMADKAGLSLRLEWGGQPPGRVYGDSGRLRQVITNLVSNALKFTAHGGIVVRAGWTTKSQSSGDSYPYGCGSLWVEVEDSGIGMDQPTLQRLFEPFTQGDSSTTRRFGGTGLGLAICRRLCQAMGGDIEASSQAQVGSVFRFHVLMPIADPSDPVSQAGDLPPSTASLPETVLVVDDNRVNRTLTLSLLKGMGISAEAAQNGLEATEMVAAGNYEVVLMDMQMPVMDGIEATKVIRAAGTPACGRRPWIVALTANAFESDRKQCFEAGMDDFLPKPFRAQDLRDVLLRRG